MESVPMPERAAASATPTVSVICTARNAAGTIAETIESIRAQTLEDWEMVIVDDGSSDATPDIVRSHQEQDPRIRLVPTAGIGRGHALNLALQEARAPLVANIDADDLAHPQRLEIQSRCMKAFSDFALTSTDCVRFHGNGDFNWPAARYEYINQQPINITQDIAIGNPVVHSAMMAWRQRLVAVSGYPTEAPGQFDYTLWVRLVDAGHGLGRITMCLAARRFHSRQQFQRRNRVDYLRNSLRVQRQALRVVGSNPALLVLLPMKMAYGLLPFHLREALRNVVGRLKLHIKTRALR